jgi:hypothetical protein
MKLGALVLAAAAASLTAAATDAQITYTVDHTYGSGSVVGQITTDGNLGKLSESDFLSWNLVITDGTNLPFDLNTLDSSVLTQPDQDVSATANLLTFDFAGPGGLLAFFDANPTPLGSGVCWSTTGVGGCVVPGDTTGGASIIDLSDTGTAQIAPLSGSAYVVGVVPAPEPATWALMLAGLVGLGAALRTRRGASATA